MKKITKSYKKLTILSIYMFMLGMFASILFARGYSKIEKNGNNMFTVYLNGKVVGTVGNEEVVDEYLRNARLSVAKRYEEMVLMESELKIEGDYALFGAIDSKKTVETNMTEVLKDSIKQTLNHSYTVKINEYTVNLGSSDEVIKLLESSIRKYDTKNQYTVELILNPNRELNVLTAEVKKPEQEETPVFTTAGIETELVTMLQEVEKTGEKEFSDFELGIVELDYENSVEVVESYLLEEELTPIEEAMEQVNKEEEKEELYEIVSGDSLSLISLKTNIPMEKLIEMNDNLQDENSTIREGDSLIVTVPEPELTVVRQEEVYYEENYDAEVIYIPNDDWYTSDKVTRQEPSAGHRKVVAITSYRNDKEVAREILKEEVVMEAVPKIVEKGTKIPPTYIKPLSGGRLSSQFGRRKSPTRGASTYHKGMDWATPRGTTVMASSSGTVIKAGWGSGYGYVVYIDHGDGRQTRYGHLSKVLVKSGQYVEQGQRIALSGNTGVSSGPHVHFEILINGSQVNPAKYIN